MILRRYMTQQVAMSTVLVVSFLTVLLLGGRMIRYFGIAAEGRLDVGLLFAIIGYNLPYFLELILPLSFFIGLMLVFGRLYVDHEMAVLNSSGLSRGYLARLMIPLIAVLFMAEAGLSLFGKPWGYRHSENIWQQQSLTSAFDLIRPQTFISNDDYHLYVGSMSDDRTELRDVVLVQTGEDRATDAQPDDDPLATHNLQSNRAVGADTDTDTDTNINAAAVNINVNTTTDTATPASTHTPASTAKKDVIVLAKRALQVPASANSGVRQLDLYQGRRYEVDANSQVYNQVSFERYRISISNPANDTLSETNVSTQPLATLWQAATGNTIPIIAKTDNEAAPLQNPPRDSAQINRQQILPAQAELSYRFTLPWLMIIAPMLAVPLAKVPPRQGRWLRLLPAILIFTSCVIVIIALKNAVLKGTVGVWAYPAVTLAFMLFALYLNWASRIRHRVRFGLGRLDTSTVSASGYASSINKNDAHTDKQDDNNSGDNSSKRNEGGQS